jgi:hypothetical protein
MSLNRLWIVLSLMAAMVAGIFAQSTVGSLKGVISDDSGAVIPNTKVTATSGRFTRSVQSGADGSYTISGLPAGAYSVTAVSPGLAPYQNNAVVVNPGGAATLNIRLKIQMESQQVTVQESTNNQVSTDPSANVGALVLKAEDLESLPDDPDDLSDDLQALAGPSSGPNGAQMYIDGFTGGRLPPKESIREIRINQNPFSAEYDHLGYGRIEIFTKPGSDKFHGQAFFNYSNGDFDGRNPLADNKASFMYRNYGGNFSGPITKKSSFFLDFEKRDMDENAIVHATTLDPSSLAVVPYDQALLTPLRRTTISPRADYQLTPNITLMARYSYLDNNTKNGGVGGFNLPSTGYNGDTTQQTLQLTETQVIGSKAVNETRFQFIRDYNSLSALNLAPLINVQEEFTTGGSSVGQGGYNADRRYELQNYTSITHGVHTIRFGGRLRAVQLSNASYTGFNGTYTFTGGPAPELGPNNAPDGNTIQITSLEAYRRTLLFQGMGLTPTQIRALGGEPSQMSITGGVPLASVDQVDVGLFAQDDWKLKPNLTLSLGLRYETQTNIQDYRDIAPRIGFAWAPGAKGGKPGKTVIRGGSGIFYDRFSETNSLAAERFRLNGSLQQQYILQGAAIDSYAPFSTTPVTPNYALLTAGPRTADIVYSGLRAPYIIQSAIGVERQLPFSSTVAVTYTNSHGLHEFDSRNINAPYPGSTVFPNPALGIEDLYESNAIFNQNQMMVNLNSRVSSNLSLFTGYVLNYARSDSDGLNGFPQNQYNLGAEYGRSSLDIRNRFFLGGSIVTKWNLRFSPFITARSGQPFNIYIGRDLNGDLIINDRPAFASASQVGQPNIVSTPWGIFNLSPGPNDKIIPRNYGQGPSFFSINLRVSRTWGFGPERGSGPTPQSGGGGMGGPGGGGPGGGRGPGGGGMRMGGGGGRGGGMGGMFGDATTNRRYNLTASINARNLLNSTNLGNYNGDLTSSNFGEATTLAGGFGNATNQATNRRIDLGLRFTF